MTGQKILIVDDEQDILDLLAYNFKKNNMVVYTAINGKEAIALADKHKPDVILLDVMLPDTDGIAVCETLREQEKFDKTFPDPPKNLKYPKIKKFDATLELISSQVEFKAGTDPEVTFRLINLGLKKMRVLITKQNTANIKPTFQMYLQLAICVAGNL